MYGLKNVRNRRDDALTRVGWDRLESMLAGYYREQGWQVEHVGTAGTASRFDGGIDLKLRKEGQYVLVQCKHWNVKQVPHNEVHQLLGIMVNEGATGAILVSSGEFTRAAIDAAQRQGRVQLVDGEALRAMLGPLPEPVSASPAGAATAIAAEVGEKLLGIAGERLRHDGGRWVRRRAEKALAVVLFKAVVGLVLLWFIWSTLQNLGQSLQGIADRQSGAVTQAKPVPSPAPAMTATRQADNSQAPAEATSPALGTNDPCYELVDHQSGTYAYRCGQKAPAERPSEAEIRESQRKADEAMKVLEASTPEV